MEINIRKIEYLDNPNEDQVLATETCPGFERAKQKALNDFWEGKRCEDCALKVRFVPDVNWLQIRGSCPKL